MDEDLSSAFRALGHPHRLRVVRALMERALRCCGVERIQDCTLDPASCNVGSLAASVSCAPSTLSRHLKELEAANVIERVRDGRFLYCRINGARMVQLREFFDAGVMAGSLPG